MLPAHFIILSNNVAGLSDRSLTCPRTISCPSPDNQYDHQKDLSVPVHSRWDSWAPLDLHSWPSKGFLDSSILSQSSHHVQHHIMFPLILQHCSTGPTISQSIKSWCRELGPGDVFLIDALYIAATWINTVHVSEHLQGLFSLLSSWSSSLLLCCSPSASEDTRAPGLIKPLVHDLLMHDDDNVCLYRNFRALYQHKVALEKDV